jgi:hypothetical protein
MSNPRQTELLEKIDFGIVSKFITEATSYPYTHTEYLKGISLYNDSATNNITFVITFPDSSTLTSIVKPKQAYSGQFMPFKIISVTGTAPSFMGELRR